MDKLGLEFAHTPLAQEALRNEALILVEERGTSENDAMVIAAATMDGAGDHPGKTVEGIATCMNLFGEPVPGLSGDDIPEARKDEFAATEATRHREAEKNVDYAALWLTISKIPNGGLEMARLITQQINEDEDDLERIMSVVRTMASKKFYDQEIIKTLAKILGK